MRHRGDGVMFFEPHVYNTRIRFSLTSFCPNKLYIEKQFENRSSWTYIFIILLYARHSARKNDYG